MAAAHPWPAGTATHAAAASPARGTAWQSGGHTARTVSAAWLWVLRPGTCGTVHDGRSDGSARGVAGAAAAPACATRNRLRGATRRGSCRSARRALRRARA
eukprot:6574563-Prymnesium_polylepis.2